MSKHDDIIRLVEAHIKKDERYFNNVVNSIVVNNQDKHNLFTNTLLKIYKPNNDLPKDIYGLIVERAPKFALDDLILSDENKSLCNEIINEYKNKELFDKENIPIRNKILLFGPSGNGKTALASAIAKELKLPFYTINYSAVIGSYLGETGSRLSKIFDYVNNNKCVLFFDEFDSIARNRKDEHEVNEIKRVLCSLLLHIDNINNNVILITATNLNVIDDAATRRFDEELFLDSPNNMQVEMFIEKFKNKYKQKVKYDLKDKILYSFSDIEKECSKQLRKHILNKN
jgi:SpoVK/Ycf46/Vps4 family AAA+-type ATPase